MSDLLAIKTSIDRKIYYYKTNNKKIDEGTVVVIQSEYGLFTGKVIYKKQISNDEIEKYPSIIRIARKNDFISKEHNTKDAFKALLKCRNLAHKHNLDMKIIDSFYTLDRDKLIFRFTSHDRIDFRELAKDLAKIYKVRIELRQIGVRDEVRKIGGNGVCGRELCCCTFLNDFEAVSIKMAKEQNISLNPSKISGNCGRLMCCLKYESEVYEEKLKKLPHIGAIVKTEEGEGEVDSIETLKERVRVKIKDGDTFIYRRYDVKDIQVIKDAEKERLDQEEIEHQKELEELEKLEKEEEGMREE